MTATQCFACHEQIPNDAKPIAAMFYGQYRQVCDDCGQGISNGVECMTREGMKGEYLGPCGDNFDLNKHEQ